MTWELRTTLTTLCPVTRELAQSGVQVETQAEAEAWWMCRTTQRHTTRVVHTMFTPEGTVERVAFSG
jgi:hypothetical protein